MKAEFPHLCWRGAWQKSWRNSRCIAPIILRKWKYVPFLRILLAFYCRTRTSAFKMAFLTSYSGVFWALGWNSLYIYTLPSDLWVRAFPINLEVQWVEPQCWWALTVWWARLPGMEGHGSSIDFLGAFATYSQTAGPGIKSIAREGTRGQKASLRMKG